MVNDGDKALCVQDDLFIQVAERNMKGILPLYYEMGAAKAEKITNTRIFDSLLLAFKANIGEVSNNITKVLNSENIDLRVVKWLTAENNYIIDFAKSLYMPTRPEWVDKIIKEYIKTKVPHFFIEAKGKEKKNVEPINNSTVNRLRKIIPNRRIKFQDVAGDFIPNHLLSQEISYSNKKIVNTYRNLDRSKNWLIRNAGLQSRNEGMPFVYKHIKEKLKEIESNEDKIVNILANELYLRANAPIKTTLWNCYGDILLMNIRENLKSSRQCESCGDRFIPKNNSNKFCEPCAKEEWKKYNAEKQREYRMKKKRV